MKNRKVKFIKLVGGIRHHNIFEEIISFENLFLAWNEFKRGKMKKADVQEFNFFLEDNIFKLHEELKNKTYQHNHYTSFYIKDPKLRHIHKACVKDRILHHAIFRILYPIFDKSFIFDSYSCRINKGTHRAINRLNDFARKVSKNNTKTCFILKCDIRKFFDSINHKILISLIKNKIKDEETVWLIAKIIKSYSVKTNAGIPLGNITSQLFANIYLNELDYFVKHVLGIKHYIRYCDDFVILSQNRTYLEKIVMQELALFLKENLKLSLHQDKIIISKYHQEADFLGYVSFPHFRILRLKTKKRMFKNIERKIKELTIGEITIESFYQTIQSYFGVLRHCDSYKLKISIIQNYGLAFI